jgi:hypothetical protein
LTRLDVPTADKEDGYSLLGACDSTPRIVRAILSSTDSEQLQACLIALCSM